MARSRSKSVEALIRRAQSMKGVDGQKVRLRVVGGRSPNPRDYTPMKLSNRRCWRPFMCLRGRPEDLGLTEAEAQQLTSNWR